MGPAQLAGSGYLSLDNVAEDPQVARRLPAELAWRYHALPVAEDAGQITVAMADPDDPEAREAVAAALGLVTCIVRADPARIDSRLTLIWGEPRARPLNLVACSFPEPVTGEVWAYAQALADLLDARLTRADTQAELVAAQADIVLYGGAWHPSVVNSWAAQSDSQPVPSVLWVAPRPRWPMQRILLVMSGTPGDEAAIDWIVRIARPGDGTVTVLTVVPPAPVTAGKRERPDQGLPALLTSASPLGQKMHEVAQQLVKHEVDTTLRLCTGPPEWQVGQEILEGDYDLIVLPVEHSLYGPCLLTGDGLGCLLSQTDRPCLVVTRPPGVLLNPKGLPPPQVLLSASQVCDSANSIVQ